MMDFVSACLGSRVAATRVAREAIRLAEMEDTTEDQALEIGTAALGWLAFAAQEGADRTAEQPRTMATYAGERVFDLMMRAWRKRLEPERPKLPRRADGALARNVFDVWETEDLGFSEESDNVPDTPDTTGVIVLRKLPATNTPEARRVAEAFRPLVGTVLPFLPVPHLAAVRSSLLDSYPHAAAATDAILGELVGRDHIRLPPVLPLGPPGSGKTRFAGDLLDALGVPRMLYPCGGASDSSLAGTSRRFITGEVALPVMMLDAHKTASPGIILDELEKASPSRHNGSVHDALLGMLEPSSAAQWHDPYLQAAVDISHVVWLATANSLESIPTALRDRCRILSLPTPGPEHLRALAPALLREACVTRGLDPRWGVPLDAYELQAVAEAWPGGSIRRLTRLLEGVLAARNHAPVLQ